MSKVTLTDDERRMLKDESQTIFPLQTAACVESLVAARVAEALKDAAKFIENVDADGELPMGEGVGAWDAAPDCLQELVSRYVGSGPSNGQLAGQYLRARAAEYEQEQP